MKTILVNYSVFYIKNNGGYGLYKDSIKLHSDRWRSVKTSTLKGWENYIVNYIKETNSEPFKELRVVVSSFTKLDD